MCLGGSCLAGDAPLHDEVVVVVVNSRPILIHTEDERIVDFPDRYSYGKSSPKFTGFRHVGDELG